MTTYHYLSDSKIKTYMYPETNYNHDCTWRIQTTDPDILRVLKKLKDWRLVAVGANKNSPDIYACYFPDKFAAKSAFDDIIKTFVISKSTRNNRPVFSPPDDDMPPL